MTDPTEITCPTDKLDAAGRKKRKRRVMAGIPEKSNRVNPAKIADPVKRTRSFVEHMANGMSIANAGRAAGFPLIDRPELDQKPAAAYQELHRNTNGIREQLAEIRAETAADHKITRNTVIAGLKEAIDMSRTIGEPAIMVAAWREIGKMCGFYEPVKVKVDLTSGGVSLQTRLTTLTDADLLKLAAGGALAATGEVIDGQCEELPPDE